MPDEDHAHGPECEESTAEWRRARASAILSSQADDKRAALLAAAPGAIERTRNAFEGFSDEQLGSVMEVVAAIISQIMDTPAYALSDTLVDSTSVYVLGSAHLLAGFELPADASELADAIHWGEFAAPDAATTSKAVSVQVEDDFRPGNYL